MAFKKGESGNKNDGSVETVKVKFEIVSTWYSLAEEMVNYAIDKMNEPIEQLQANKITVDQFKKILFDTMLKSEKGKDRKAIILTPETNKSTRKRGSIFF